MSTLIAVTSIQSTALCARLPGPGRERAPHAREAARLRTATGRPATITATDGVLPQRWATSIVVGPTNANHVYASFSNYKEGDLASNVWETTDGDAAWHNISTNMPNAPVWMLTYDQPSGVLTPAPTSEPSTWPTARTTGPGSVPGCPTPRSST